MLTAQGRDEQQGDRDAEDQRELPRRAFHCRPTAPTDAVVNPPDGAVTKVESSNKLGRIYGLSNCIALDLPLEIVREIRRFSDV